jgi:hypothetical protein
MVVWYGCDLCSILLLLELLVDLAVASLEGGVLRLGFCAGWVLSLLVQQLLLGLLKSRSRCGMRSNSEPSATPSAAVPATTPIL